MCALRVFVGGPQNPSDQHSNHILECILYISLSCIYTINCILSFCMHLFYLNFAISHGWTVYRIRPYLFEQDLTCNYCRHIQERHPVFSSTCVRDSAVFHITSIQGALHISIYTTMRCAQAQLIKAGLSFSHNSFIHSLR